MTDQPLPDDIGADHLAHLDNDITLYEAQLSTLQGLVERAQVQLDAAKSRADYVAAQLDNARQERASFVKSHPVK